MKAPIALLGAALGAVAASAHADAPRPAIDGVSHIAIYASDGEKSGRFYGHDLGAHRGTDPETPAGVRYYFLALVVGLLLVEICLWASAQRTGVRAKWLMHATVLHLPLLLGLMVFDKFSR